MCERKRERDGSGRDYAIDIELNLNMFLNNPNTIFDECKSMSGFTFV